jgi:divalent metal cation (Fe/Co/Zn/Cd) transporter
MSDSCCDACEARRLHGRALLLSYLTVGYNVAEGVVSLGFGAAAGSIALVGFGLDSFIESLSGVVMIWRFGQHGRVSEAHERKVERRAVKLVGWTFFVLAAYITFEASRKLVVHQVPDASLPGIIIALVSLVTMPTLFVLKRRTARAIKSTSLVADSKQTLACTMMSAVMLVGLVLNSLWHLWYADPIAGLVIAGWLVKEGIQTLRAGQLCAC